MHRQCKAAEMKIVGIEAATALNQRPGPTGVSASMMLFGQRLKLYGELYANGEPTAHPDATDNSSALGRRLQIRATCRQACEIHYAKELVRKAASARTRTLENTSIGEIVFFYRRYPTKKATRLQAQRGCWLGPSVIIGHQGQNLLVILCGTLFPCGSRAYSGLSPR